MRLVRRQINKCEHPNYTGPIKLPPLIKLLDQVEDFKYMTIPRVEPKEQDYFVESGFVKVFFLYTTKTHWLHL